ncbi:MAG: arabinose isomerase, partial [Bacilli bacterium]
MLINTKAKVGVFAIALGAYLPQFPSLVNEFNTQFANFKKTIPSTVEIIDGGIITTKEAAQAAGNLFRAADVDVVFLQLLTYATSYNMLPAIKDLDVPVILINIQKLKALDYDHTDIASWLGEGYACGAVGEMVADLERYGKRHAVITGVVEGGDKSVQDQIEDWCKAAQTRRRFRDTNIAQIGRPYPGMMDLYIDESNLYRRMGLYTKQFDWEKMWVIADNITDEKVIHDKAQEILDTFEIEGGGTIEKVWEMAKYVVAFEKWVKDEKIGLVASHYDGFAKGPAGVLDSMLIPAFSMLIKQGVACAVEGDMKVSMAMSILKTIAGSGQLSEMYSIDFNDDIAIIGHSGSGDADISEKKPTMKIVKVFHGKSGGGYLTQFYPHLGPVTYLAITQDGEGHFKFVVAEGINEPGKILSFGDTNMRTRFTCGARE